MVSIERKETPCISIAIVHREQTHKKWPLHVTSTGCAALILRTGGTNESKHGNLDGRSAPLTAIRGIVKGCCLSRSTVYHLKCGYAEQEGLTGVGVRHAASIMSRKCLLGRTKCWRSTSCECPSGSRTAMPNTNFSH